MATLSTNWLTEGLLDFEYKKYTLLAYLQETARHFDEKKLYPRMTELLEHYTNLQMFKHTKMTVAKDFPKQISKLDFEKFQVEYKQMFDDDELLKEIDSIIEFALPAMEQNLGLGKELYEEVEHKVEVFPVGIVPLRNDEGYFFLSDYQQRMVNVYRYTITIFQSLKEQFRGINTHYLFTYRTSVSSTYEQVKHRLIHENTMLPNPATYVVEFKQSFPLPETMLPVAKRSLVRYIATA